MKEVGVTYYECELCGHRYESEKEAKSCESKPITQDKGVKIGDVVLIKTGDGAGKRAKVSQRWIYDKYWGHYAYKRYWHTVGLAADYVDGIGTRQLTFDDYEPITKM